jgi:hypothetical protein
LPLQRWKERSRIQDDISNVAEVFRPPKKWVQKFNRSKVQGKKRSATLSGSLRFYGHYDKRKNMKGTLVNTATVIIGSLVGLAVGSRFTEKIKTIVMQALGLCTLLIGIGMALNTENILLVIGSLVLGGIVGELLRIEDGLERIGDLIKKKVKSESGTFVLGFVTASLVFCVGPMTIIGSIQDGISGKADTLYAKSMLDGFASIAFASSLGVGVFFSSLTVLIFQGALTLLGSRLAFLLEPKILNELIATGGLMILGIGFYLLDIKRIKVGNFLPALVFAVVLALIFK